MDVTGAIGLAAAPGIVSGVLAQLKQAMRALGVSSAFYPLIGLLPGVAYSFAAWGAGIVPCDNLFVATLLGLTVGLGAVGWRESTSTVMPGKA